MLAFAKELYFSSAIFLSLHGSVCKVKSLCDTLRSLQCPPEMIMKSVASASLPPGDMTGGLITSPSRDGRMPGEAWRAYSGSCNFCGWGQVEGIGATRKGQHDEGCGEGEVGEAKVKDLGRIRRRSRIMIRGARGRIRPHSPAAPAWPRSRQYTFEKCIVLTKSDPDRALG